MTPEGEVFLWLVPFLMAGVIWYTRWTVRDTVMNHHLRCEYCRKRATAPPQESAEPTPNAGPEDSTATRPPIP